MIYITGDTHGEIDFKKLEIYFKNEFVNEKDVLIILGDAGIIWNNDNFTYLKYIFKINATIIFVDGNHENFDLINEFPIVEKFGAKMHRISERLFHVLRGEIMNINGLRFFCMGGASSIDKACRIEHLSWWDDENITYKDMENGLSNLERNHFNVDYVLTHCAPTSIANKLIDCDEDNNTKALEILNDKIHYKKWYFGHYHIDKIINDKFRCFYQDIIRIDNMYNGKHNAKANYYVEESDGFLYSVDSGRKTKLRKEDLGEFYYGYCQYEMRFYRLQGVKDIAYKIPFFDNHIDKDVSIFLSYKGKLKHNAKYEPMDKNEWDIDTWRVHQVEFIHQLEKYNTNLNLNRIKSLINISYDQFNNGDMVGDSVNIHPFLNVKTIFFEGAKYYIQQNENIYAIFINLEKAQKYVERFIKKYFGNYEFHINQLSGNNYIYEFGGDNIYIKEVREEQINHKYRIFTS